jgi:hypothetical protein
VDVNLIAVEFGSVERMFDTAMAVGMPEPLQKTERRPMNAHSSFFCKSGILERKGETFSGRHCF